jgi:hypothetical protein
MGLTEAFSEHLFGGIVKLGVVDRGRGPQRGTSDHGDLFSLSGREDGFTRLEPWHRGQGWIE